MKLRIQLVHRGDMVKDCLERDGWKLTAESDDSVSANHAEVHSEATARLRLYELGLLTSPSLRVEFPPGDVNPGGEH